MPGELNSPGMMFDGFGVTFEDKSKYIIQWARKVDGVEVVSSCIMPFHLSSVNFFAPDDVDQLSVYIGLTDFLFAETARTREDVQRPGKTFFSDSSLIPFDIFY
ncbi:MAG: hypothetical protein U1E43_01310 [Rhodospirillales bacterium]